MRQIKEELKVRFQYVPNTEGSDYELRILVNDGSMYVITPIGYTCSDMTLNGILEEVKSVILEQLEI